jgi:rhodanese-related sulfurtransferase
VTAAFPGKGTKLLINSTSGGADADAAVGALVEAGYTSVVKMEGGYEAYDRVRAAGWGCCCGCG